MATRNPPRPIHDPPSADLPLAALGLERPVVVSSDATLQTAAQAMLRARRSVVVVGSWTVVTEHDIARAVALGRPPTTPAAAISTCEGLVLHGSATVTDAIAAMVRESSRDAVVIDDEHEIAGTIDLTSALEVVLGGPDVPLWLSALRCALHGDPRRSRP